MNDIVRADGGDEKSPKAKSDKYILKGFLLIIISLMLYNLNLAAIFAVAPMMLFAAKYGKKKGSIFISLGLLVCLVWDFCKIFLVGKAPINGTTITELAITMYIPVSLSAAGIVWIQSKNKKLFTRILLALIPSLIFVLIFVVLFLLDRALFSSMYELYKDAFAALLQPVFDTFTINLNMDVLFQVFLLAMGSLIMPVTLAAVCANCFIYETCLHSKESNWEERVMSIEFNPDMVWAFIIAWGVILLCYFVSVPMAVEVVAMNIGFMLGVIYALQGFAVLYTWLKRSMERLKSMTLFIVLFIISTGIPGLNFIVLLGLPLLGLLESFFDMKKIGEKKHEDYS